MGSQVLDLLVKKRVYYHIYITKPVLHITVIMVDHVQDKNVSN